MTQNTKKKVLADLTEQDIVNIQCHSKMESLREDDGLQVK